MATIEGKGVTPALSTRIASILKEFTPPFIKKSGTLRRPSVGQPLHELGDLKLETIGGLERHLYYSPEQNRSLIESHRLLAEKYAVTDSYLNFVGKGEPLLLGIPL